VSNGRQILCFRLIPNTVTALMARVVFLCVGMFPERTLSFVVSKMMNG
jgi:hypothetical protein